MEIAAMVASVSLESERILGVKLKISQDVVRMQKGTAAWHGAAWCVGDAFHVPLGSGGQRNACGHKIYRSKAITLRPGCVGFEKKHLIFDDI